MSKVKIKVLLIMIHKINIFNFIDTVIKTNQIGVEEPSSVAAYKRAWFILLLLILGTLSTLGNDYLNKCKNDKILYK